MTRKNVELLIILLLTLVLYWPSFEFDFVNFDDQVYVLNNSFVQNPSLQALLDGTETGNFHPLTMLTLRIDQWLGNGNPSIFHITNVLWHLLNSVLVYVLLTKVFPNIKGVGFFVSLMFAIHPMHIESVAWVSSRKDVVYAFFFLLSMLSYWQYLESKNRWLFLVTFVAAICSFLGKPSSIVLPLVLCLIFYVRKGELIRRELLPVGALLIGSIFIGLVTMNYQSGKSINDFETYSLLERGAFALYGIGFYSFKALIPSNLSPMHPYPSMDNLGTFHFIGYTILGVLTLIGLGLMARKNKGALLGGGIFLLSLVLTLQLVSIGRAIVSERYTYLAYIGLFLVVAVIVNRIPLIKPFHSKFYLLSGVLGLPFFFLSTQYLHYWKNSESLWSKAIVENPGDWYGYVGRGNFYEEQGLFNKALIDFQTATTVAPQRVDAYYNLGDLQFKLGQMQDAVTTYSAAINLKPANSNSYVNRGQFYVSMSNGDLALADFNHAILLDSANVQAHINRGNLFLLSGNIRTAIADFISAVELDPYSSNAWYNKGTAEMNNDLFTAEHDLLRALELNPNYFDAYNNLGSVYYQLGDLENAEMAFSNAIKLNPNVASIWLNLSVIKNDRGDYTGALESAIQAKNRGGEVSETYLIRLRRKL